MGGYGSGRWGFSHRKATTAEQCLSLDANRWMREGILAPGARASGLWQWTLSNYLTGERKCTVSYLVSTSADPPYCRLEYTATIDQEKHDLAYKIMLRSTPCTFGGVRWWFVCPLVVDGRPCSRQVGKLYLPPGCRYFGCRRCYQLSYKSSQESDKRISALLRNPDALLALAENATAASPRDLFTYVKVMQRLGYW